MFEEETYQAGIVAHLKDPTSWNGRSRIKTQVIWAILILKASYM